MAFELSRLGFGGGSSACGQCVEKISGTPALGAVSYGTEAGLFQAAGIPAVICGPGDISRAHRPEEYLTEDELASAAKMVLALGKQCAEGQCAE